MSNGRPPLTAAQLQVWESLQRHTARGEPQPTYRELCAEFGWSSTATARDHLQALAKKGYIDLPKGRARAIRVKRTRHSRVPLLGRVTAGRPVAAEQFKESWLVVPPEWLSCGEHFAVWVSGDSMKDAGIFEGDKVVARVQAVANDGDIVVATVDGETTLKRLRRRGAQWWLVPENRAHRPIRLAEQSVAIQGVMVGLVRGDLRTHDLHFPIHKKTLGDRE
jgi:repressor LexA